ncbi:MAG: hypothetical protein JXA37_01190 [Chloroflexia bacterium]|nr:hypothetical protein [Chloroflexia bacterium]
MHSLVHRIRDLNGLPVRLHVNRGSSVVEIDGICAEVTAESVVLAPWAEGERVEVKLKEVGAVTQLSDGVAEGWDVGAC